MARIAVVTDLSCALSWWARLQDEGNEVMVYHHQQSGKRVGEGIVPLAGTFDEAYKWLKEGAESGEPVLFFFDSSSGYGRFMGDNADRVRKSGIPTIGAGGFCDLLENDRVFGFKIAEEAGCKLPPYQQFKNLTESEKYPMKGEMYFKSDTFIGADATKLLRDEKHRTEYFKELREKKGDNIKHILQEKMEGVALSTARWWNGMNWSGPYQSTYEHKAFMNDDVGPSTGCSFNAVFFHGEDPLAAEKLGWEKLTMPFRKYQAPAGLYDINAVVTENGDLYFLEWTPRLGYDTEPTAHRLYPDLGQHLFRLAEGRDMPMPSGKIAYSTRLTVPPYPWEHGEKSHKGTCDGLLVRNVDDLWRDKFSAYQLRQDPDNGLVVASPEGIVGLSIAVGTSLKSLGDDVNEYAKDLGKRGVSGLQFRTDGAKMIKEDAEKVKDAGHSIHPGLLK